ncbi:MAG: hypothetical protein PHR35_07240 [Kiritimatiellae bacterium]|nr:hypothetical protein [Kiritimatiellia bacterium]
MQPKRMERREWVRWWVATLALCLMTACSYGAKTWNGGSGLWSDGNQWTPSGAPGASDDVVIDTAGAKVLLSEATTINSLIVSNTATLTFTNWTTKLTVAGDVWVRPNATITLPPAFTNGGMSNRVWIACDDLTIDATGKIDANSKGFATTDGTLLDIYANGEGGGFRRGGGGHGGHGAGRNTGGYNGIAGRTYGSATSPEAPGSASVTFKGYSYVGNAGGGAVRIECAGDALVNGEITADGGGGTIGSGGAGGSIWVTCDTIQGSGSLTAKGGGSSALWGGGGGRIAVHYTPALQAAVTPIPTLVFSTYAAPGTMSGDRHLFGDLGTLYFPDNYFLSPTITRLTGRWMVNGFTNWAVDSLTISNASIRFPHPTFKLTVTNSVTVFGAGSLPSAGLGLGGDEFYLAKRRMASSSVGGPELSVGGSLGLTNGGCLFVYAGITNATTAAYGAHVRVGNALDVANNSAIFLYSHPTNGGSVKMEVGSLKVATSGRIEASEMGYAGNDINMAGNGPGRGLSGYGGGSHGGRGGVTNIWPSPNQGLTYGSSNAPVTAGSSGQSPTLVGGSGGGVIWVEAANSVTIAGTCRADGEGASCNSMGGGAGGSIYIRTRVFSDTAGALLSAAGGTVGSYSSGGGGGRIAVWRAADVTEAVLQTTVSGGGGVIVAGSPGTVVWKRITGTVIVIH